MRLVDQLFLTTLATLAPASLTHSQTVANSQVECVPAWTPTVGELPGFTDFSFHGGQVRSLLMYDDGSGSALFVGGGGFDKVGNQPAMGVVKWDGSTWSPLPGFSQTIQDMEPFDDGNGELLYLGTTSALWTWDGQAASQVPGATGDFYDLQVFDDGSGAALYAAGRLQIAGGSLAGRVVKWDGSSWSNAGSVFGTWEPGALAIFDDGQGSKLYVGGGGPLAPVQGLGFWSGSDWQPLVTLPGTVYDLQVFDDGAGPALYVGGAFSVNLGGGQIAENIGRWDGAGLSTVGSGVSGRVYSLCVFDDGNGAALYAGGRFTTVGGLAANSVARWNGANWSALGTGIVHNSGFVPEVLALASFDDGSGPKLCVGGDFDTAGGVAALDFSWWDGLSWSASSAGLNWGISALTTYDDGAGPVLYMGGAFTAIGDTPVDRIAKWDGQSWTSVGQGITLTGGGTARVSTFVTYDSGAGPELYAGGHFSHAGGLPANNIARWDGTSWSSLGTGVTDRVYDMAVFDDGSGLALYAVGQFDTAGGVSVNKVARWDGTSWSALGIGFFPGLPPKTLEVFDDGSGPALWVGGDFIFAGGVPVHSIAKWDGATWSAAGILQDVADLAVFNDGSGPALYAVTQFPSALKRWDGTSWQTVTNVGGTLWSLYVHDDGSGPALLMGGEFTSVNGVSANGLARWDGVTWSAFGGGTTAAYNFASVDDGAGVSLFVGSDGEFFDSGDMLLGRWGCLPGGPLPVTYCTAKTSSAGCVSAIGTSNSGLPTSGSSDYSVTAQAVQEGKNGLLFAGISGAAAIPVSGGILCVQPPTKRGPILSSRGDNPFQCDGSFSTLVNDGAVLPSGLDAGAGNTGWYQYWYRDPQNGVGALGTALTDAVQIDFQ